MWRRHWRNVKGESRLSLPSRLPSFSPQAPQVSHQSHAHVTNQDNTYPASFLPATESRCRRQVRPAHPLSVSHICRQGRVGCSVAYRDARRAYGQETVVSCDGPRVRHRRVSWYLEFQGCRASSHSRARCSIRRAGGTT